jgi:hypothetical protein
MLAKLFFVLVAILPISAIAQPTKPTMLGQYAYLEITPEHEGSLLSLPCCVAMVLNFYRVDSSRWTAKRVDVELGLQYDATGRSVWTGKHLASDDPDLFNGTSFKDIQDGIKKMGYAWDRWDWPDDTAGFRNAINAVELSLDDGKPVVVGEAVHYTNRQGKVKEAHLALLAFGYDEKAGELIVMDPTMQFPGKRHIPFGELKNLWDWGGHYRALFTAAAGKIPTGHKE